MSKLLHIEASPRQERSKSNAAANVFLRTYQASNPNDTIETLNVWGTDLPAFDNDTINAKYAVMHGRDHSAEEASAWREVVEVCDRFKSADKYLLSLPMWNFGIPYKLKHYFDVISQPGQTFSFSPESGYSGLVTGRPITVIYARGGTYGDSATSMDFQRPYVEFLLGFLGFTNIETVVIEPTMGDVDAVAQVESTAAERASKIAAAF